MDEFNEDWLVLCVVKRWEAVLHCFGLITGTCSFDCYENADEIFKFLKLTPLLDVHHALNGRLNWSFLIVSYIKYN